MRFESLKSTVNGVLASSDRFPGVVAVRDDGITWSYSQLRRQVFRAIAGFIALGVEPGDRIGLCALNSARWIVAALGVQGAGGVLVPLNTRFMGEELAYILGKSRTRWVVAEDAATRMKRVHEADCLLAAKQTWLGLDGDDAWHEFIARGSGISDADVLARIARIGEHDISDILFTSGTTGFPKGVAFTHGQSLRAYGELGAGFGYGAADRFLLIPPFFHALGYKSGWFAALLHGSTVLPERGFDPQRMIERIERDGVTMMIGPPTIFAELLEHPGRAKVDLSSLRLVVASATNVPPELVRRMRTDLGLQVLTGYGLTEASAIVTYARATDDPALVADSVGRPAPAVEVRVVDDADNPVPAGEIGNILVSGYNVMNGYWEDPESSAEVITPAGLLRTGDIGSLDEGGFLRVTGRKKDVVIVGGFNVYPAEVERVLSGHPLVAEVAVVGVADERLGEVPFAYVVAAGAALDGDELLAWARPRMANFKVPRYAETVDRLPKNPSMKVLREELRARATASLSDRAPEE